MQRIDSIPYAESRVERGTITLAMDAYLPDAGVARTAPVQILHGGGFKGGSRDNPNTVRLATLLTARGIPVFAPSYRTAPDRPVLETIGRERAEAIAKRTGHAEAHLAIAATEDAAKARRFVAERQAEFGVDTARWGVMGFSAGGVAALLTGYAGDDFWGRAFEGIAAVVEMWAMVPPQVMGPGDPPLLIVHGDADQRIPYKASSALVKRGAEVGVPVERITLAGAGHGHQAARIFERQHGAGTVADRIVDFLDGHLR